MQSDETARAGALLGENKTLFGMNIPHIATPFPKPEPPEKSPHMLSPNKIMIALKSPSVNKQFFPSPKFNFRQTSPVTGEVKKIVSPLPLKKVSSSSQLAVAVTLLENDPRTVSESLVKRMDVESMSRNEVGLLHIASTASTTRLSEETVIRTLAGRYKYSDTNLSGVECCSFNRREALALGLGQRAAFWGALETLLPQMINSKSALPITHNLLRNLLSEVLDNGDCQSFVVCTEILRREKCVEALEVPRILEGYVAYIGPCT
jgi:hypothetical protein